MSPSAVTWAAVLGPGPGSVNQGLAGLLAFLTATPLSACNGSHGLLAVPTAHHAALLAALPPALGEPVGADWPNTLPNGFHRLNLGPWVLTLCVGPVLASVGQWHGRAQHLWVGGDWPADLEPLSSLARPLARQCAHGATLALALQPDRAAPTTWTQAGFTATTPGHWRYQPRWPVTPPPPAPTRTALVIGAGLAGAAACASLTRRGWQVTLLDAAPGPAQGASGLPVGMLSEHVTARETVLSRLSRSGMALHTRALQRHVPQGQGWQTTWVTNLRQGDDADHEGPSPDTGAPDTPPPPIPAITVRPAVLVHAWLAQAQATGRLQVRWGCAVARLQRPSAGEPGLWQTLDAQGQVLAQAAHVVVAAAYGSAALLPTGEALRPVKGQLSFGPLAGEPLAAHPLRDHGVYVPCFEDSTHPQGTRLWAMGSTYERGQQDTTVSPASHDRNAASLAATLPAAHALFERQRASGELQGWAQVRCASLDRLPLVGAVPTTQPLPPHLQLPDVPREPGLWTLCALGSRGLTLSMLGAELLAAQMEDEPWPVEKDLALALDPARFALKHARKSAEKNKAKTAPSA